MEAAVGVVYSLLTLQAVAATVLGDGALAALVYNGIGLLIAGSILRHASRSDARTWFDAP